MTKAEKKNSLRRRKIKVDLSKVEHNVEVYKASNLSNLHLYEIAELAGYRPDSFSRLLARKELDPLEKKRILILIESNPYNPHRSIGERNDG